MAGVKGRLGKIGSPVGVTVIAVALGLVSGAVIRAHTTLGVLLLAAAFCVLVPALLAAAAVLGSVLAGLLVGFRPDIAAAGPVALFRRADGFRLTPNSQWPWFFGSYQSVPRGDRRLRARRAVELAGAPVGLGLLVLLLAGSEALILTRLGPWPRLDTSGFVAALEATLVLATALTVLIWFTTVVDAIRAIQRLLRGDPEAERDLARAAVRGASLEGRRPREWDERWVARLAAPTQLPAGAGGGAQTLQVVQAYVLAYDHALDRGDVARAGALLDRVLAMTELLPALVLPALPRALLHLEAAYFTARHRRDAAAARAWLERAAPVSVPPRWASRRLRAEAAVLHAEGEHATARTRAQDGLAALDEASDPGTARAVADWLHELAETDP